MMQGTLCFKEYKNGVEELYNYSDLHISCKYGFCEWGQTPVQVGTITDASLQTSANYDFITISGDGQNIVANWDETQHVDQEAVIYDVVITVDNMKINKYSKGDPDTAGWYSIGDCQTIDGYEENPIYFSPGTTNIYDLETQEDTKAWSTTEPYFGTGVIADGAYYDEDNDKYIVIDGTNHPGELSFSSTDAWDSNQVHKYSKQTSGSMFYCWYPADITECTDLNHYTWDTSYVWLCYDNTTTLTVNGKTYTKQNPSPSYYEIKCGFTYGGSVRPGKIFIRWGTNEPYTEMTSTPVGSTEHFSWQESSVPSGEVGTLVVEFTDSNNNGLLLDSFSSQDYTYETDNMATYGGTRLLIKTPDNSNIYDYSAGNFIECNITLSDTPEPPEPPTEYYTISGSISGQGTISGTGTYEEGMEVSLTATPASGWEFDHWYDNDNYEDYYENPLEFEIYRDWDITAVFEDHTPPPVAYPVIVNVIGQGGVTGAGDYAEGAQVTLTAAPSTGYVFSSWQINGTVVETNSTYQFIMGNQGVTITAVFEEEAEKHIYLCDNSGAHLAEMTKTGSTWDVTGSFTSGMYSVRATVEGQYDDAWFKFYQTQGDNRIFVGAGDDPDFEEIGTYIVVDNILTSLSLAEDQTTGYYVVSYENTGAMTTSMVDTIVNSYIGDFVTGSDIAEMGYMTATDISSMSYIDSTSLSAMSYVDSTALSNMSYVDTTYLANQDYSTKSYMMSYVSDAISGIQPGGPSSKTVTMSCTGGDEYELSNAIFYIPNTISNVTFVQKWQRTNSTSGTWTIYNFNMGSTAVMRIGLPTDKYVSSLTLTCNGYSDTFNVTTVPTTSSYQDITIYYWGFQHVWQYLNDYDWTMTIVYSNKPQSINIDWMINNGTLQSLANSKGLTSVEHGSQNISDFTSDVVLTDMKTLDNSGKTDVYLNGVSSSMEDMTNISCLLFRTSNLNAANPTKSDIEAVWETARWNCIEEQGTPAATGDWEVVYYINGSNWCPAATDAMTITGSTTRIQNNLDVSNWTEQPSDQYKYFYYIKTIEIMSME